MLQTVHRSHYYYVRKSPFRLLHIVVFCGHESPQIQIAVFARRVSPELPIIILDIIFYSVHANRHLLAGRRERLMRHNILY